MKKEEKEKQKTHLSWYLAALIIVGTLSYIIIHVFVTAKPEISQNLQDCIDDTLLTIYFSPVCPHCKNMEELLKDYKNINWINCVEEHELCQSVGIIYVPSYGFYKDGNITIPFSGEATLEELEKRLCGG